MEREIIFGKSFLMHDTSYLLLYNKLSQNSVAKAIINITSHSDSEFWGCLVGRFWLSMSPDVTPRCWPGLQSSEGLIEAGDLPPGQAWGCWLLAGGFRSSSQGCLSVLSIWQLAFPLEHSNRAKEWLWKAWRLSWPAFAVIHLISRSAAGCSGLPC